MKPPRNSKQVFSGILFNVHQWEQEMFDGSHKTFEIISRKPAVDVIALVKDKIIVLMQEQPAKTLFPSLPGGGVKNNQAPLQAAQEELLEETGYRSSETKLLVEFFGGSKIHYHQSVFVARHCRRVADQSLDNGEMIEVTFRSFDDFLELCRDEKFTAPLGLKFMMYEALIDHNKKEKLKSEIFGF